jgi:hypothetical protein
MEPIPIDTILPEPTAAARTALVEADVIIAVDLASQREFTVFGTPALESTMSLRKLSAMRVVRVSFDGSNKELEMLMAVVRRVKGPETYEGTDE